MVSLLDKSNASCKIKEETDTVRGKNMKISLVTDIGQRRSNNQDFINDISSNFELVASYNTDDEFLIINVETAKEFLNG